MDKDFYYYAISLLITITVLNMIPLIIILIGFFIKALPYSLIYAVILGGTFYLVILGGTFYLVQKYLIRFLSN